MKRIFLIIIFATIAVTDSSFLVVHDTINQEQPNFKGEWEWLQNKENNRYNFSLTIASQIRNKIEGYHLAVSQGGRKIDYASSDLWDHPSIKGKVFNGIATITFESSFTLNKTGIATLKFIAPDKIEWNTVKEIDGENYFPNKAILVRE